MGGRGALALLALAAGALPGVAVAAADTTPPATPSGLTATGADRSATLKWTKNTEPDLKQYNVYRQKPDGSWPTQYGASTSTTYNVSGLTNGVTYGFRITAVDTSGNQSPPTAAVTVVPRDKVAPPAPTGLTATPGDGKIALAWTASSATDIAYYRLYRSNGLGTIPTAVDVTGTTYTDLAVVYGTTYTYTLTAYDTSGNASPLSAPVSASPLDLTAPRPPSGVAATAGDNQVAVRWSANPEPDVNHYAVYRQNRDGSWPTAPTATVTGTSWTDTSVLGGRAETYRVTAFDNAGNESAPSGSVTATPFDTVPPASPTGPSATAGESQVMLSWNASPEPDFDHYAIYRQNPDGSWGAATATATSPAYVDGGLTDGTAYTYRITAVDASGNESAPSSQVTATPVDQTPPAAPTGLTATPGDGQIDLAWSASPAADLDHYRLYRSVGLGAIPTAVDVTGTAYTDRAVSYGTTYTYTLTAYDTSGNASPLSAPVSPSPLDLTAPTAPSGVGATAGDNQVGVSWSANPEPDVNHYAVYRQNRDGSWPTAPTATVTGTSWTDTSVLGGRAETYRVTAFDNAGNESAPSGSVTATPFDTVPPAPPTGLTATAGESQVVLSWNASPEPDFDHYAIYRQNPDGSWGAATATATSPAYVDGGLADGTAYTYRITAVDASGNESAPSSQVTATPVDLTPPPAPTGLGAKGFDSEVDLTWTASPQPDLDHYLIYRQNNANGTWPTSPTASTTATTYADTGLTNGTWYTYRITAVDKAGNESAPSGTASAIAHDLTPPAPPTGLQATGGNIKVDLSWNANTESDFNHYSVYRQASDGSWPTRPLKQFVTGTSFADTSVLGGTTYTYRITAVDALSNESAPSSAVSATPTDNNAPATPATPYANPGDGQIGLSWTANPEFDVNYEVFRQNADGSWPATPLATTTHDSYVDRGLTNGSSYTYQVIAKDSAGFESGPSAGVTSSPAPVSFGDPGSLFAANSVWNQPLDPGAPADPNSDLMISGLDPATGQPAAGAQGGLLASVKKSGTFLSWVGYSTPVYIVGPDQPLVPFHVIAPEDPGHPELEAVLSKGVPVPAYAQSAAGTDGHMTIYQPSTDTLWDFWRACSPDGPNNGTQADQKCPANPASTWTAQFGGVMNNVSQSPGYFDASSYPGYSGWFWGATATSLPVVAGTVTMAELQAGHIDHALALDVPGYGLGGAACAYKWWKSPTGMGPTPIAFPAQRSDGTSLGSDCIPEGARLQLDPTLDVNSLALPKVTKMFAVAAQKYGMIVRDHASGGPAFFAEDPLSVQQQGAKINPYTGRPWSTNQGPTASSLLQGTGAYALFKNFPWDHVKVLQMTICHAPPPGPCPPGGN